MSKDNQKDDPWTECEMQATLTKLTAKEYRHLTTPCVLSSWQDV